MQDVKLVLGVSHNVKVNDLKVRLARWFGGEYFRNVQGAIP
jgi:hypothetical protein